MTLDTSKYTEEFKKKLSINKRKSHELFDEFVKTFIWEKKSFLTDEDNIQFTQDQLDDCWDRYVVNINEGSKSYDAKIKGQFEEAPYKTALFFAHIEWLWCSAVTDMGVEKKINYAIEYLNSEKNEDVQFRENRIKKNFPTGFMVAGFRHVRTKSDPIRFGLILVKWLFEKTKFSDDEFSLDKYSDEIERFCLFYNTIRDNNLEVNALNNDSTINSDLIEFHNNHKEFLSGPSNSMRNILLHMVKPNKYEDIVSDEHKSKIVTSFSKLFVEGNYFHASTINEKIILIKNKIGVFDASKNILGFYDEKLARIWNPSGAALDFDEMQGLQFKKSIILYGPPGTSKTHTAFKLAESLILQEFIANEDNLTKVIDEVQINEILNAQITHLQMHTNYNYEDFIAGVHLKNGETIAKPGDLLELCRKINAEKSNKPHVLILDEINRVDLSRLFGEFFSAMENREKSINISVGGFKLIVPNNLYIIGTMNEIDFSLERVDFALRRRFVWYFMGFDESILKDIIVQKSKEKKGKPNDDDVQNFINMAKSINKKISEDDDLGQQYQIGHTFFGEVIDIYFNVRKSTAKGAKSAFESATKILWDISICPMLDAFLGNVDLNQKVDKLAKFKLDFLKNGK